MATPISANATRERLADLLSQDLAFRGGDKPHPLHSIHAFAAKFPAQLPRHFIQGLSGPGEVILDPMAGSGSTLVEGWLLSRKVIGVDLDPLALKLCRAKTARVNPATLAEAGQRVLRAAQRRAELERPLDSFRAGISHSTGDFIDYWFLPETQRELAALALEVSEEPDSQIRNLLEVLFSATIVTKSGGVSRARDLAHSRPHRVAGKLPRRPLRMFETQLRQTVKAFGETRELPAEGGAFLAGDSRRLPLADESVDLIVTSPPYANAIDYMRAHKFSLVWLGEPVNRLSHLRGKYIGAERQDAKVAATLPDNARQVIATLAETDRQKARVLDKYLREMSAAIQEMRRVIRPGRAVIIVVGPSTMRGMRIATHECLAAIAGGIGFEVVQVAKRPLNRDRRMMPARREPGDGLAGGYLGIEGRMRWEYVIGLVRV